MITFAGNIIKTLFMKKTLFFFALLVAFVSCNTPTTENTKVEETVETVQSAKPSESAIKNLTVYPAATEGMNRYVIMLDSLGFEAEYEYQIELIPGKLAEVDSCNKHGLSGEIVEKTVEGFGYTYYEFTSNGNIFSTQMACLDNAKVNKFISGQTIKTRYNSLLPVVVYIPEGFELKYKIWSAGELKEAQFN